MLAVFSETSQLKYVQQYTGSGFFAEKFVLISIHFIANSSITCCLCFLPCAVAKFAVAHVSQTIRFEISSNGPPTSLFSNTRLIIPVSTVTSQLLCN